MTSDAFVRHFTEVADASPVPVLLYNVTLYTGVNLLPDAVERLAVHPNIVGHQGVGIDIGQIAEYVARTPDDFTVLAGSATTLCTRCARDATAHPGAGLTGAGRVCARWRRSSARTVSTRPTALQRRLMPLARSVGTHLRRARPQSRARPERLCRRAAAAAAASRASSEVVDIIRRQLDALDSSGR